MNLFFVNHLVVQTSVPQNEAELQLYRVMQRASLLSYYDTLLEMGGDDVQQLCDAGEEEFLEIMALVGMASKPLHVRRLQKALQEWLTNPCKVPQYRILKCLKFSSEQNEKKKKKGSIIGSTDILHLTTSQKVNFKTINGSIKISFLTALFQTPVVPTTAGCKAPTGIGFPCVSPRPQVQNLQGFATTTQTPTPTPYVSSHVSLTPLPCRSTSPIVSVTSVTAPVASTTFRQSPSPNTPLPYATSHSPGVLQVYLSIDRHRMVMAMPDSDPRRMEEIRKYAAIYGRFDCKRKPEKPLTLHEVSVNEAAAQICSLSVSRTRENGEENEPERTKRQKLELEGENEDATQEELDLRCPEMDISNSTIRRHRSSRWIMCYKIHKFLSPKSWLLYICICFSPVWRKKNNNGMFSASIEEISDSDSQLSFSNEESSSIHDTNEAEADNTDKESDFNLKVIASRGDNIIAVANPALMECNHPIKEEPTDEKPTL
ncbi:hypothetical protein E2986_06312 [Frieseomelitta varia]|uniref:Uncharacterized protein n=1 Tax=Frieseomelitta varia TaxID=561572 RepID=A0A833VLL1_9HYME|nr:hypothetical protein E2986_06312 [Frieseomelitta varia]